MTSPRSDRRGASGRPRAGDEMASGAGEGKPGRLSGVEPFRATGLVSGEQPIAVSVLPGTARLDEERLHAEPAQPVPDGPGRELGSVVRSDVLRWAMFDEQVGQALQHIVRP